MARRYAHKLATIRRRIARLKQLRAMQEDGTFDLLPKKEVIKLNLEIEKLEKFMGGIKDMTEMPGALSLLIQEKKELPFQRQRSSIFRSLLS